MERFFPQSKHTGKHSFDMELVSIPFPNIDVKEKELSHMKRAIYAILAVTVLTSLTGCLSHHVHKKTTCMAGDCAQVPEDASCTSCDTCDDTGGDPACHAGGGRGGGA